MSTLDDVSIDLAVQLGTATMPVHQLLRMGRGAVIALDKLENDDVTVLAHNMPIAEGQILVQGEKISIAIKRMLPVPPERRRREQISQPAAQPDGAAADTQAADGSADRQTD